MNRIVKIDRYKTNKRSVHWSLNYYFGRIFAKINFTLFLFFTFFMLVKYKNNGDFGKRIKNSIRVLAYPQILLIKGSDSTLRGLSELLTYFYKIKEDNFLLKQENFALRQQLMGFKNVSNENEKLKEILNFISSIGIENYKITELEIVNKNVFSNRIFVDYGSADSVSEDDLVVDLLGNVIGKIINVGENESEILLLTDSKSRIVAKSELSKLSFIVVGNESKYLNVSYILGEEYNFKEGESIFVNNLGKKVKNDFLIGKLVKDKQGKYKVKMKVDFNKIDYGIIILKDAGKGN